MERKNARAALLLGGSLVLLFLVAELAWPTLQAVFQHRRRVAWQETGIARYRAAFLEDQKLAAALPILAPRPGTRDAGPVLLPAIAAARLDPAEVKALGERWPEAPPFFWSSLDFGWMAGLEAYDFWDLDAAAPRLDVARLGALAKLRLARALAERAPGPAIAEVEELARLCFTAERRHAEASGLALLAYADRARERSAAASLPVPGKPLGEATITRLFRAAVAASAFTRLHTPADLEADVGAIAIGRCGALEDGLDVALAVRPFLRPSHAAGYERLGRLLAGSGCRLTDLRRRWAVPDPAKLPELEAERGVPSIPEVFLRLVSRHLLGEWAISGVEPSETDLFSGYGAGR